MFTRRQLLLGAGIAAMALGLGACSKAEELTGRAAALTLPLDTPHTADAAAASGRIAWEIMVGDKDVHTANAAISPSSLAVTLAMLAEGATGESLASLDEAFGLSGDDRSAAVGALRQALAGYEDLPKKVNADDPPETPVVHQANRVVILDDAEINSAFLDRLSSYYDAGATRVPFAEAKPELDAWAAKHTAGLVQQTGIDLVQGLFLVTQDAVLFAARWRSEFSSDDVPLTFTAGDGTTAAGLALAGRFPAPYAKTERWEAVRLAYDDVLAMDVILPRAGTLPGDLGFEALHESATLLGQADETDVDLTMPPSNITAKWELVEPLREVGINLGEMGRIFDAASIDQLSQLARLIVTAKGTVGAAVTEGTSVVSAPETQLVVDRPFIMRVLDTRTGWPLFLAIVNDPAQRQAE